MKADCVKSIIILGAFLFLVAAPCRAAKAAALDNGRFAVTLYCTDDLGDYCSAGEINNDRFLFDDGTFVFESFSENLPGFLSTGSYSESGIVFSADLQATKDVLSRYAFDVQGIHLLGRVLLGRATAEYSGWVLAVPPRYEKFDEAVLYFVGIAQ